MQRYLLAGRGARVCVVCVVCVVCAVCVVCVVCVVCAVCVVRMRKMSTKNGVKALFNQIGDQITPLLASEDVVHGVTVDIIAGDVVLIHWLEIAEEMVSLCATICEGRR